MLIERVWAANSARNFHYLVACPETGEALAIDPLEWGMCVDAAKKRGWTISQVLNTHEHWDHTGGNAGLVGVTHAKLLAHEGAANKIGGVDRGLKAGDVIKVGKTVELECLDTPGHTFTHICALSHTDEPALFSGDTLFNAGAGNCHTTGQPELLYETFATQLARLPDATRLYPGHEYLARNLEFTLDREPQNKEALALLAIASQVNATTVPITTLGQEKQVNSFFRLQSPAIIAKLRERFPELGELPSPRDVFLKLRELRNAW